MKFVWQETLTEVSTYLDDLVRSNADIRDVAIAGWTPDTMDPPTMALTLRRRDLRLRYFEPSQSLLIPDAGGLPALIMRPTILPLHPLLEDYLVTWNAPPHAINSFTQYRLENPPLLHPQFPAHVTFAGQLTFLGYDAPVPCPPVASTSCHLVTYWRVVEPANEPRRLFLHLIGEQGETVDQADGLVSPPEYWRPGDIILQLHSLETAVDDPVGLRLGVYNPVTGARLSTDGGDDTLLLEMRP